MVGLIYDELHLSLNIVVMDDQQPNLLATILITEPLTVIELRSYFLISSMMMEMMTSMATPSA